MTHGWIKTDLTVKPSPPYQYEVLFMTPIYLIKNTVFAAMKHFFTNKWRMCRSLRGVRICVQKRLYPAATGPGVWVGQ